MNDPARPDRSLYDSRAVPEDGGLAVGALVADGFERRPQAVSGVVYLRKRIGGPVDEDDGKWMGLKSGG